MRLDLRSIVRALGGEISGGQALVPGPGHSKRDRSLSIKLSATSPDGFVVHSHAGDDWQACRDYVLARLGLPHDGWKHARDAAVKPGPPKGDDEAERERAKAQWLWRQGKPAPFTIAEIYLRSRGHSGAIPSTLRYLPARDGHEPALMAAFGMPTEPEPGVLAIADADVKAVQLVKLKSDGSGKSDVEPNKITIGCGALGSPIVVSPPNDLLGMAVCEGVEDALSVHQATGLGAWAAGGAGRMPALADAVPSYIDFITIVAHRDPAGIRHANALADGLSKRRMNHRISYLVAEPP
jgi:Toprim domain